MESHCTKTDWGKSLRDSRIYRNMAVCLSQQELADDAYCGLAVKGEFPVLVEDSPNIAPLYYLDRKQEKVFGPCKHGTG